MKEFKEYLFEISIAGEGARLRYIPISAPSIKEARKLFAKRIKEITQKEFWLFGVFRRIETV